MARIQSGKLSITPSSGRDFFPINRLHSLGYETPPTEIYTGFKGIFTKGRTSLAGIHRESVNSIQALRPSELSRQDPQNTLRLLCIINLEESNHAVKNSLKLT